MKTFSCEKRKKQQHKTITDWEGTDLAGGQGQTGEECQHAELPIKFQANFPSFLQERHQY